MESAVPGVMDATGKGADFYRDIIRPMEWRGEPHEFVAEARCRWEKFYKSPTQGSKSLSGNVFELIVQETLWRMDVKPFYSKVSSSFVASAKFDFMLYHPLTPVALSVKTSLVDRWKMAAYEGFMLQQFRPKARSVLITDDETDARIRQRDIDNGVVRGLDECVYARTTAYKDLLLELADGEWFKPEPVLPFSGVLHE